MGQRTPTWAERPTARSGASPIANVVPSPARTFGLFARGSMGSSGAGRAAASAGSGVAGIGLATTGSSASGSGFDSGTAGSGGGSGFGWIGGTR